MKDDDASATPRAADSTTPAKPKNGVTPPDGTPTAGRSGVDALKKLKISGSATPYLIAALLAATAMGWYFFAFVPQKLDYFVGLRFRTLAVASGQIKSKAENLALSLNSSPAGLPPKSTPAVAPTNSSPAQQKAGKADSVAAKKSSASLSKESDTARYLRLLVPDIQLEPAGSPTRPSALRLQVGLAKDQAQGASVAWGRVASQAAAASATEFDDLVIADVNGDVVWQREKTTPRLGNLKELVYAADDGGSMLSPSSALRTFVPPTETSKGLPRTAMLKAVRVGTSSSLMLVQAVQLESPFIPDESQKKLYVAGFVSRYRLQQQAMRIPLAWLVALSLPIAVLFLALPFIKLGTMNAKERFSVANLILMAIGTLAAAGLAAAIPVGPRPVSDGGDRTLRMLADRIETNLEKEVRRLLALSNAVAAIKPDGGRLKECQVKQAWRTKENCDLWSALETVLLSKEPAPELDVAILIDDRGLQVRKWTTKIQLTGAAQHYTFEHYRNLASENLWSIDGDLPRFTMEPLRTPTTAEVGVLFGLPLTALPEQLVKDFVDEDVDARYLALNVRLRSVIDVVMPAGHGFAVVAPDGRVLFHSTDGLSLEENFFEEVSNVQRVRERMRNEGSITWSGDYHGVPHRIHLQPITKLHNSPWKIVTFEDLSPALAAVVNHQNGTLRLSLLNLVLLVIGVLGAWWYTKRRGRDIRDVMTAPFSPDPKWLRWQWLIAAVTVFALIGSASSIRRVDLLYLFFVAMPFGVLTISLFARRCDPSMHRRSRLVSAELALVVILVGFAPAAGFARLVERVQNTQAAERWLEDAAQATAAQAARAHTRAVSPSYSYPTRQLLKNSPAFEGGVDPLAPHFQIAASPFWIDPIAGECKEPPDAGQRVVRWLLRWSMFSAERRGDVDVNGCAGTSQLQVTKGTHVLAATVWPVVDGGGDARATRQWWRPTFDVGWEFWLIGILILAGTIAAAYWAQHRLTPPSSLGHSTFEDVVRSSMAAEVNQGIMLIGPPRMRKDQWVEQMVALHAGLKKQPDGSESILRIKLLDETITPDFIKRQLAKVSSRGKDPDYLDDKKRLWIQVSNLEAQLITAKRRAAVLGLLEQLLDRDPGESSRVVVVTTTIDPVAHFQEIFTKEREDFYDDKIPEVQLSRSSLVLSRFRRCYLPIPARPGADPWWNYDANSWRQTLAWEAADYPPLQEVARDIELSLSPRTQVSRAELARTFRSQALAPYDLLWESCTRSEKIVLVQLATEGFVTPRNREVVWGLIHKGLIVERPRPTIFNNSFRLFLRHIERDEVVEQWEREDGNGLWVVAGRLIGSSLIAGGLFFLATQDFSFDSLLPVVSGTGAVGAPLLRAILTRVTTRGAEFLT